MFPLVDTMVLDSGLLHMKKGNFTHNGYITETIAKGGRKLKKRRKGKLQQSYLLASSTHRSSPKPADIQLTARNYEGVDITYNMSWRKLQEVKEATRKVVEEAFELAIPFLEEWKENNENSMVEWLVDDQKQIQHVFVFPAYTDKVLSYMCPVISIDVAHLKLAYRGIIFIYSGLTGNDKAYVLAFGISGGNEDDQTWNTFNKLFAMVCLSVSLVENGHSYSKFVFVSDRDKGLDKSLAEIFPSNHAMNSVHHIKQNVKSRFGAKAAEMVFPIAHAFSMIKKKLYWSS